MKLCVSIGVVFGIFGQVVFHPSMDVDGPSIWVDVFWICWIVSTIDFFNHYSFSQFTTFFVFLSFLSLNTCSSVTSLLVVTITSTTFISTMIVYLLATGWTSVVTTNFPWNIFCISTNFGQSIILCPFKPQMWHAYEDVFCGFWLGCVAFVVATVVYFFFFLHVSTLWFTIPQFVQCLLIFLALFFFLLVLLVWYSMVLTMHSSLLQ